MRSEVHWLAPEGGADASHVSRLSCPVGLRVSGAPTGQNRDCENRVQDLERWLSLPDD